MKRMIMKAPHGAVLLTFTAILAGATSASAQQTASSWQEAMNARARLIAGTDEAGSLLLGVDIALDGDWKTYWRNPGDAGIPPLFDFSGSDNLENADIAFPAPVRLPDPAGESIGYKHRVVFPVTVKAADPERNVDVVLKLNYAVCEVLCIPVEQELTLTLPPQPGAVPQELRQSVASVPATADARSLPRVLNVARTDEPANAALAVDVLQAEGAQATDLFVEGPQDWYLPLPQETGRRATEEGEIVSYAIDLGGLPKDAALSGTALTLTMTADGGGKEQRIILP